MRTPYLNLQSSSFKFRSFALQYVSIATKRRLAESLWLRGMHLLKAQIHPGPLVYFQGWPFEVFYVVDMH